MSLYLYPCCFLLQYLLLFISICLFVFIVEGKAAKLVRHLNKEASNQYGSLTNLDREKLVGQVSSEVEMTVTQRTRRAKKLFINIMQNQVIKYRGYDST